MKNNKQSGFTLMELMIVVAIVGIIAGIALPSYQAQVAKSKRADAKIALLKYAQIQESYFVQNLSYANTFKNVVGGLKVTATDATVESDNELYRISLVPFPADCDGVAGADACTSFELNATPINEQLLDQACGSFKFNSLGKKEATPHASTTFSVAHGKTCW